MFFQGILDTLKGIPGKLPADAPDRALAIGVTVIFGVLLFRFVSVLVERYLMKRSTAQRRMIARKVIRYTGVIVVAMVVLRELGVELVTLLGAAGIVGIAVGFASQTSVSNIISGIFLISEKPFAVGDVIKVGGTTGIIQSIDLLSIKIRTFDNLFVRIPNEKILTSEVTNVTRFPIRRMDITFQVPFDEDLSLVHRVLSDIAKKNPHSLDEPEPLIVLNEFKENGVEVIFGLWFSQDDYLNLKNSIMIDISSRLKREGILFANPKRTLSLGEAERLFDVRIVEATSPPRKEPAPMDELDRP